VDQPLTDRRIDARFAVPRTTITRATLRPGCAVRVVNLSAGGALVQADQPIRPGARVHVQIVTTVRAFALVARVLRCAVWTLDPHDGATYRGALQFEDRCETFWEHATQPGSEVPCMSRHDSPGRGNVIPAVDSRFRVRQFRSLK
jgi:hypothetical protein